MATKPDPRPPIPAALMRAVRQRCGFGCVVCGLPLYHYDHINDWADVKEHKEENLTLLCDRHHREKTSGLLPLADVLKGNADPFNLRQGISAPYDLHFSGRECEFVLGNSCASYFTFRDDSSVHAAILIDDQPLLWFQADGTHLLLSVVLCDEENNLVLRVKDNCLVYSIAPWDIEFVGRSLKIRDAARSVLIALEFEPPNRVAVTSGRFRWNGIELLVSRDAVTVTNNGNKAQYRMAGCPVGLAIGRAPMPQMTSIGPIALSIGMPDSERFPKGSSQRQR